VLACMKVSDGGWVQPRWSNHTAWTSRAGIRRYLRIIGITRGEVHAIRKNLLQPRLAGGDGGGLPLDALSTFSMGAELGGGEEVRPLPSGSALFYAEAQAPAQCLLASACLRRPF
jgi:hypothetical protein